MRKLLYKQREGMDLPCRLFPVQQILLVQSGGRSLALTLVPVIASVTQDGLLGPLNFSVERNPWDNEFFGSYEYLYMKSSNLVLDKTMLQLILIN